MARWDEPGVDTRGRTYELPDGAVLLDASTVDLLASYPVFQILTGEHFADGRTAGIMQGILLKHIKGEWLDLRENEYAYGLNHALSFLELWILSEDVFVDWRALKSLETPHNRDTIRDLAALFQKTAIHDEIQEEAGSRVVTFYQHLTASESPLLRGVSDWGGADFDLCLKDDFYQWSNAHLSFSANSRMRAIFYLEVSHILGVPLFLHPQKSQYLAKMGQAFQKSCAVVYGMIVDEVRAELGYEEHEISVPPIADEIVRVATERGVSLVKAAKEIRDVGEMAALRKCIAKLCRLESEGRKVELRSRVRDEARQVAGRIEKQWNVEGRISRRRIDVAELPWIGPFLKAVGYRPRVYVRDFDVSERPFVALFSRWANEVRRRYE